MPLLRLFTQYKDAELNEAEQALMQAYISKLAEYSQYIPERDNAKDRGEVRSLSFTVDCLCATRRGLVAVYIEKVRSAECT